MTSGLNATAFTESDCATVKRVVLTGGPCGGKSTVQAMMSDVFENLGWKGTLRVLNTY
jgi:hypothetical protein